MSQIEQLVCLIRDSETHRAALKQAQTHEELVSLLVGLAEQEGLYIEQPVIEAAVLAAQADD